ncbi:MAG TPA: 5'/3'-nucleotidase SurE [Polyangiaceae bacterium]|nr:5'/3'-nucleotidase SurE [Polyangiaceae bacterium]
MASPAPGRERPLVLLSNDDGYRAPGIGILRDALREAFDVVVCAPETQQSATSHALTLSRPMRLHDHGDGIRSLDGTPADCVYVALHSGKKVLPRRPALVVSGMNHGLNLGTDVFYSGTVAAAREGALRGYPSIACSASHETDMVAASRFVTKLALATLSEAAGTPLLLNVNFPPGAEWPVRSTRLGARVYTDTVEFRKDPRGMEYLWLGGPGAEHRPMPGSDTEAFDEGAVSVTPLLLDLFAGEGAEGTARIVRRSQ